MHPKILVHPKMQLLNYSNYQNMSVIGTKKVKYVSCGMLLAGLFFGFTIFMDTEN